MQLSFRHRMFRGLVALGTLPLVVALVALVLEMRQAASPAGARASLDEIARSGRTLIESIDTASLNDSARAVLRAHAETIARRTSIARRAELISRTATGIWIVVIIAVG